MAQRWKVGDKVKLASGGPVMTVTKVDPVYQTVECHWFDGDNKAQVKSFPPEALVAAD